MVETVAGKEWALLPCRTLEDSSLHIKFYSEKHIVQLVQSIGEVGMVTPLLVWRDPSEEKYQILNGHYRIRAARRLRLPSVPCHIVKGDEECSMKAYCQSHLLHRSLGPIEEAYMIERFLSKGLTMERIGHFFKHDKSWVSRRRKLLLNLHPRVRQLLEEGELKPRLAQELTKLPQDNEEQEKVYALLTRHRATKDTACKFIDWWLQATDEEKKAAEHASTLFPALQRRPKDLAKERLEDWGAIIANLQQLLKSNKDINHWWPMETWDYVYHSTLQLATTIQSYRKGAPDHHAENNR